MLKSISELYELMCWKRLGCQSTQAVKKNEAERGG